MVDPKHELPVVKQCQVLQLPRSTYYYVNKEISAAEIEVMNQIDRCHTELPFYGSRRIKRWLADQGKCVNRKKVQRLMRLMGIEARYPKRRLSLPGRGHKIYPYLLRDRSVEDSVLPSQQTVVFWNTPSGR